MSGESTSVEHILSELRQYKKRTHSRTHIVQLNSNIYKNTCQSSHLELFVTLTI